jgi:hypothetical protein
VFNRMANVLHPAATMMDIEQRRDHVERTVEAP